MNGNVDDRRVANNDDLECADPPLRRQRDEVNFSIGTELDRILADSMLQLSVDERESTLDELHGIRKGNENAEEDAASMNRLLGELDRNLKAIKKGTLYAQAERNHPSYVSSRDFRMMFLRASEYDPEASVHRILTFLEIQKSLFPEEKIGKKIMLDDLDKEATESIESGAMQISASTDRAGRKILLYFPKALRVKSIKSNFRARYYISMAVLESEQVQRMGIVAVHFGPEESEMANHHRYYSGELLKLPLRWAGIHACIRDWETYYNRRAIYQMPSAAFPRFRIHCCGSDDEFFSKLGSFGIPRDALPLSVDGLQLDNRHHLEWYRHRQQVERDKSMATLAFHQTIVPGPKDVLFGRVRSNVGNRALRSIVSSRLDEYNLLPKHFKARMAEEVVKEIGEFGGRFLKQNPAGDWEEVSLAEAVQKTAKTFRNCRRTT
eukprot:scaffold5380_cov131-Cylindrotheca_fusiformis.AAC.6